MKRSLADMEFETLDLAKCMVLLSRATENTKFHTETPKQFFECNTCNRKFSSFQALGGHRASHKKPKLSKLGFQDLGFQDSGFQDSGLVLNAPTAMKPKTHECSICGLEFSMGQALGGHMRRHRANMVKERTEPDLSVFSMVPVLKRSNSSKRVVHDLDLNLTPLENDLKLFLSKMAPKI